MNRILPHVFLFLLLANSLRAQEIIPVYFETGSAKISTAEQEKLNALPTRYDLSELASVEFRGMADTVGNLKANLALSERRAKNVAFYCKGLLPENIPVRVFPKGETSRFQPEKSRRVDVILFFKPAHHPGDAPNPDSLKIKSNPPADTLPSVKCYQVDYHLLHRSHQRIVTQGKKEFILIETTTLDNKQKKEHAYATVTDGGKVNISKVKWTSRNTGHKWWAKKRYVATIPRESFDRFKIFFVSDPPCDSCSEVVSPVTFLAKEEKCIQVDRFLMQNLQIKSRLFPGKWANIRVPREYVNPDDTYYYDCEIRKEIKWESRSGRKRQNYYYTRLPLIFRALSNIIREMDCCKADPEPSECDRPQLFCRSLREPDSAFVFNAEVGWHYRQSQFVPYAGPGLSKEGDFSRISLHTGMDSQLRFHGALRYQFHFYSLSFSSLNPFNVWRAPGADAYINRYLRFYTGTELLTKIGDGGNSFLSQNIHLGLALVHTEESAFLPRIFIQAGLGFDYLGGNAAGLYPVYQFGIILKLARFGPK